MKKPLALRCFSLSQATRFGQHTVARVLTHSRDRAERLFLDFYRGKGLPQTTVVKSAGLVVGCIQLLLVEEARPELHKLQPNVVTPIGSAAPHRDRQHAGIVFTPPGLKGQTSGARFSTPKKNQKPRHR